MTWLYHLKVMLYFILLICGLDEVFLLLFHAGSGMCEYYGACSLLVILGIELFLITCYLFVR